MKNIVIYAMGTSGDIDPMAAFGMELVQKGFKVTFLSNDYFEAIISASGCEFVSVGTIDQYHKGNSINAWQVDNHADNFEHYHAPAFEPAFNFIKNTHANTELLIALGENNGAVAAANQWNLPFVKVFLSPNVIFSAYRPPAPICWGIPKNAPQFVKWFLLHRYRRAKFKRFCKAPHTANYRAVRIRLQCPLKLEKESAAVLQIGLFPEWYGQRAIDWPRNLKLVGFPLQNRLSTGTREKFDAFVEQMGAPLIFTTGTGVKDAANLCIEGRKICEKLNWPGLFVGGDYGLEVLQGADLCAHMKYIDFEYALPKALAIVHHGGIGTCAQAIKAGIPQLIRPLKYDQPDNANRIYHLGLGTYVMPDNFKAEVVAPILQNMVNLAQRSQALKAYATDVKCSNAVVEASNLVAELIRELQNNY